MNYHLKNLLVLNNLGWTPEYCIQDHTFKTDYIYNCNNCQNELKIDIENATSLENLKLNIDSQEFIDYGGTGVISKIIQCDNCKNQFFIGIGYLEPNNGRDVYVLRNIIELETK